MEAWRLKDKMESSSFWPLLADSYQFDEEQDPDPYLY